MGVTYRTAFRWWQNGQIKGYQLLAENDKEDLLADLVSVIYSFCTRLYGPRRAKWKTETIVEQLKQVDKEARGETS